MIQYNLSIHSLKIVNIPHVVPRPIFQLRLSFKSSPPLSDHIQSAYSTLNAHARSTLSSAFSGTSTTNLPPSSTRQSKSSPALPPPRNEILSPLRTGTSRPTTSFPFSGRTKEMMQNVVSVWVKRSGPCSAPGKKYFYPIKVLSKKS